MTTSIAKDIEITRLPCPASYAGRIVLDSYLWVPKGRVPRWRLIRDLVVQPKAFVGEATEPLALFVNGGTHWGLPIAYGLKFFQVSHDYTTEVATTGGMAYTLESAALPPARFSEQSAFFLDFAAATAKRRCFAVSAPTGSGKTIAALRAACVIRHNTLVVCPTVNLAKQWIERACDPKLFGIPRESIGLFGGGKKEWEGKDLVCAVIHSLTDPESLPSGFDTYFGLVIWDEYHNLGARTFCRSLLATKARYRVGMSATPTRKDGCEKVFDAYFGRPLVQYQPAPIRRAVCKVYDHWWPPENRLSGMPAGVRTKVVSREPRRNEFLAKAISLMVAAGRNVLALSDSIAHLSEIRRILMQRFHVPAESVGVYARQEIVDGKRKRVSDKRLAEVAEKCQVILATYGLAREGLDIPRLNAGVDLTPRAGGTQVIGRLRPSSDGIMPFWVTVRDRGAPLLEAYTAARLRDYEQSNVEVREGGTTQSL